jgi:hypothetical protein
VGQTGQHKGASSAGLSRHVCSVRWDDSEFVQPAIPLHIVGRKVRDPGLAQSTRFNSGIRRKTRLLASQVMAAAMMVAQRNFTGFGEA